MPSIRALAAATLVACAALALPAGAAAPKPQIVDPAGDALPVGAGTDIVSGLFSTSGTTAKVGKKRVYTPTKLLVTVTYAGAVATEPYVSHQVAFDLAGCGHVYLELYAGGTFATADCLEDPFTVSTKMSGKTLQFSLPFGMIGKSFMKKGAGLTGLTAYTAFADPVVGLETVEAAGAEGAIDFATSGATYRIA